MTNNNLAVYDVHECPPLQTLIPLSFQHLFAMFGATVLVPILTGFDTSVALICSGIGTLVYIVLTKRGIPAYLGSSFAFIAPLITASKVYGHESAALGVMYVAIMYVLLAMVIRVAGKNWLKKILPPVVVGPVIMVIGLGLANVAVSMATKGATNEYHLSYTLLALSTLGIAIVAAVVLKGIFKIIPILIAVVGGYGIAAMAGMIDFKPLADAAWFAVPNFTTPTSKSIDDFFSIGMFLTFAPIALVTVAEHIGDQTVISKVIGRSTLDNPGIDLSILGDGIGMAIASFLGGPPLTTYGENVGVITITRVYSVYVIAGAAMLAVIFGFINKIAVLIHTIPVPVMGGVSILLFGLISSSGLRVIAESKVDLTHSRNLVIASSILVIGIGGAALKLPHFEIEGMGLAAIVGILLHLVLPHKEVSEGESI